MAAEVSYSGSLGTPRSYRNGSAVREIGTRCKRPDGARAPPRKVPHVTEEPQLTRGKRIVLCFDGTAKQIGAGNLTNVAAPRQLARWPACYCGQD
jgi:hypothetical protein